MLQLGTSCLRPFSLAAPCWLYLSLLLSLSLLVLFLLSVACWMVGLFIIYKMHSVNNNILKLVVMGVENKNKVKRN